MLTFYKKPFLPLIKALGQRKAERHFSDPPIFIGGCGRSGTTLLLSIISAHPQVFACPKELGLFNKIVHDQDGKPGPSRIDRLYRCIISKRVGPEARRFCEKSPGNVKQIDVIDSYFKGEFRFIHIIRDGRDVVLSRHPTDKQRYWVDPERWVNDVRIGLKFKDHPKVLTLRYEDLVDDYSASIRRIGDFCQLPLTSEWEDWFKHTTVKRNVAYSAGVQKLHNSSVGKWRKPKHAERVAELMAYPGAAELLAELGYGE